MNMNRNARELLDRYLLGVRNALPLKKREDIVAELESMLLDRLDERYSGSEEISESQLKEILTEMGSPRKVAASYGPQQGLIGPQLFPSYLLVLRIVVPVVIGALTLSFIIGAVVAGTTLKGMAEYFGSLWNGAFMAAAYVTLVFVIIERIDTGKAVKELEDLNKFNPEDLPALAESEKQPSLAGTVFEIVIELVGFAFLIYILSTNGSFPLYINLTEKFGQVRFFTDSFLRLVPGMMAVAGLEIIRSSLLLLQGHRTQLTNGMHLITEIGHILITILLLGSFPIITVEFLKPIAGTDAWDIARIQDGVNIGLKTIMALSIFGSVVGIIKQIIQMIKSNQA